jgi:hypothetical protein
MKQARVTLPCALAWRAMTELVRRHHAGRDIALEQVHPGSSTRGAYVLWLRGAEQDSQPIQIAFNLGGPSGTWSAGQPEVGGELSDLLLPDPARAIDRIEQALGLPAAPKPVPPSSQSVLGMRLVASLLEGLVFHREPWRATLGAHGHNGGTHIADWVRHLGLNGPRPDPDRETLDRLGDQVLLHRCPDDTPVMHQDALQGTALLMDLRSGVIGRLDTAGWQKTHQLGISTGFSANALQLLVAQLVGELG